MLKKEVSNSRIIVFENGKICEHCVFPLSVSLKIQYMKQLAQK